jgi:hypothetical protein
MSFASPITRQTVGKTFIVGISVLGIGALLQLGAVGWLFFTRFRTTPDIVSGTRPTLSFSRGFEDPFGEGGTGTTEFNLAPGANGIPTITVIPARPVSNSQFSYRPVPIAPAQSAALKSDQPQSRFNELIEQARTLRERGDTSTAITRFREALALEPQNPLPLAEIATTYEKMGVADKAAEQWRRIYDMGEAAGVYFTAAEAKMKASQANALLQALPTSSPEDLALAAEATRQTAPAPEETPALKTGTRLGVGDVSLKEEPNALSLRKFTLRVPLHAKPRARIDVRDVTIQVLFYDLLEGRTLDKTHAQVSTRWVEPPGDWGDSDLETLEVTYAQTPPEQGEPVENRKFYGYLVRVYYKDALQDARAEPARLGQTFPAPRILQTDPSP